MNVILNGGIKMQQYYNFRADFESPDESSYQCYNCEDAVSSEDVVFIGNESYCPVCVESLGLEEG